MSFIVITVVPLQLDKGLFIPPWSWGSDQSWDLVMERHSGG